MCLELGATLVPLEIRNSLGSACRQETNRLIFTKLKRLFLEGCVVDISPKSQNFKRFSSRVWWCGEGGGRGGPRAADLDLSCFSVFFMVSSWRSIVFHCIYESTRRARAKDRRNARKHTNSTAPENTQQMQMPFLKFSVDFLICGSGFRVSYPVFLDPSKNMFFLKWALGCTRFDGNWKNEFS